MILIGKIFVTILISGCSNLNLLTQPVKYDASLKELVDDSRMSQEVQNDPTYKFNDKYKEIKVVETSKKSQSLNCNDLKSKVTKYKSDAEKVYIVENLQETALVMNATHIFIEDNEKKINAIISKCIKGKE